jgi:hypothetical protein
MRKLRTRTKYKNQKSHTISKQLSVHTNNQLNKFIHEFYHFLLQSFHVVLYISCNPFAWWKSVASPRVVTQPVLGPDKSISKSINE